MNDNRQLLDVLTREGVIVAVNVRYWRARKKLDAQDVGLDPDGGDSIGEGDSCQADPGGEREAPNNLRRPGDAACRACTA